MVRYLSSSLTSRETRLVFWATRNVSISFRTVSTLFGLFEGPNRAADERVAVVVVEAWPVPVCVCVRRARNVRSHNSRDNVT